MFDMTRRLRELKTRLRRAYIAMRYLVPPSTPMRAWPPMLREVPEDMSQRVRYGKILMSGIKEAVQLLKHRASTRAYRSPSISASRRDKYRRQCAVTCWYLRMGLPEASNTARQKQTALW